MIRTQVHNRDENIDILKAICLICMILGHCGFPGTKFIYLFHMPLFFMASGYLFNKQRVTTYKEFQKFFFRKIKSLWMPYVVWNTVFLALQNFFLKINFYTNNLKVLTYSGSSTQDYITWRDFIIRFIKILFLKNGTVFTSAFWFIRVLFVVEIMFAVIILALKSIRIRDKVAEIIMGLLAILSLVIGYFFSVKHISLMDFAPCFVGFNLFWLGTLMKNRFFSRCIGRRISIFVTFIVLAFLNTKGIILLNKNQFTNPIFLICSSICGWIFLYGISKELNKSKKVASWAYQINLAAIDIMALHFIGFKLVAIVQVYLKSLPEYHLARFPVLDGSGGWWILYFLAGLFLPIAFYNIRIYCKRKGNCADEKN